MIKTKKDKIKEINTKNKCKSKDIVTQKLAIEVLNSSIRLLCWSKTLLNFTDPVARNVYVPNSLSLTVNSGDSFSASNSVQLSTYRTNCTRFPDRLTRKSSLVNGSLVMIYTTSKMYSCHLLLWANHQQRLHSYVCIRMLPPKIDC